MKQYTSKDGFYISLSTEGSIYLCHVLLDECFNVKIPRFPLKKLAKRIDEAKQSLKTELDILSRHGLINPFQPGQYPDHGGPMVQGGLMVGLSQAGLSSLSNLLGGPGFEPGKPPDKPGDVI